MHVIITFMKRPALVAIFAHPDDEAFGPAGTIKKYSETHDIYLICATRGEAGENHLGKKKKSIAEIREEELKTSAKILGVKRVIFLDYIDGCLCNNQYHEIANKIRSITDQIKPEIFLTFEIRGVSGHLDHVAIAMITNYIFYKVQYVKKLMSYVILRETSDMLRDYFIHVPHGFRIERVDETVDISKHWNTKKRALLAHQSQKTDVSRTFKTMDKFPKVEYFLIHKK